MIEFCLKFFLSTNSWLHACVGIERAIIVQFGAQFNKKRSITMAKLIISLIIFLNMTSIIHDPFYRHLIEDPLEQRAWCVISYPSSFLKIYDTTTAMFHFLMPFLINIISAIIIIIKTARMKSLVMDTTNYYQQFYIHKHLIISPIILICLAVPRLIISLISTLIVPVVIHVQWLITGHWELVATITNKNGVVLWIPSVGTRFVHANLPMTY
ncbi:unnamed protein product [Rotaria sordida]|uniref:G-protein coupled receptors family 1 profile domain-containing protein n=1 Tax=Rotaria sordida TaxID=392033 RepID=A0A815TAY4_9BILA|nr:unnamed protein product [Rotaria sordida]CAF1499536.1 unnamed protein product [Rotaria sordida]